MKKLSDIQAAVLNEADQKNADKQALISLVHGMSKENAQKPDRPYNDIIITVGDKTASIPFSTDSYMKLISLLED